MTVPSTSPLASRRRSRGVSDRTALDRIAYLQDLSCGAFYPAALREGHLAVSRWAEEEGYVYPDPEAARTSRGDYSFELNVSPSAARLTCAGEALVRSGGGVTGPRPAERAPFSVLLSLLLRIAGREYVPGPHPGCAEFEPDPFPGEVRDAAAAVYWTGWDCISAAEEFRRSGAERWDHEGRIRASSGGYVSRLLWALSPYVSGALELDSAARKDAWLWMRDRVAGIAGIGYVPAEEALAEMEPETRRVLSSLYGPRFRPRSWADLYRGLRAAGLVPVGAVPAQPDYPRGRAGRTASLCRACGGCGGWTITEPGGDGPYYHWDPCPRCYGTGSGPAVR